MTKRAAAMWTVLFLTVITARAWAQADACTVVSTDEIKTALGRQDIGPAKRGRASGSTSECTFPGLGAGDVRIVLNAPSNDAAADFDLKEQILKEEQKPFEKLPGIGDGAYYYDDRLEFRIGTRLGAVWVNRTARTETAATVKAALITLARRMATSLRAR